VHLRDLGTHRLKDLSGPEHLFQLVRPGLPDTFPPLATLDVRPYNRRHRRRRSWGARRCSASCAPGSTRRTHGW
jgi:hypothetical protein